MNTEYKKNGYLIVRNYLSPEWADCLRFFFLKAKENKKTKPDTMSPGSHGYWGANPYELLLDFKTDFLKKLLKWDSIVPTYSYGRIYKYGATLLHHIDRPSCQLSVTVNLGGNYTTPWPLWITKNGHLTTQAMYDKGMTEGEVNFACGFINPDGSMNRVAPIQPDNEEWIEVNLEKGDAMIYMGMLLPHWRNPWVCGKKEYQAQLFMHYVDEKGPFKDFKYDKRPGLNY